MYEAKGAWLNGEDYPELVIGDEWDFNLSENPDMPQQVNALFVSGNYLFQVLNPNSIRRSRFDMRADVGGRVIGFREVSNPLPFDDSPQSGILTQSQWVAKHGHTDIWGESLSKPTV